ncbi:MAG TPA: ComEC/Rec2 family competence protein [Patescibacteria group bacterium]|nr:ComEC/Rec2 family competence protein [Patescibacteria group bacterium]
MKKLIKILAGLLIILLLMAAVVWLAIRDSQLKVYFFDVGQGDAVLIRTPSRQNVIIDGGPDNVLAAKLGQALPFYDRTVDLMILTHPHDDHLVGLIQVLEKYQVKQILYTGALQPTDNYLKWLQVIKDKGLNLKIARAGQNFVFGQAELNIIYPVDDLTNQQMENLNNSSIVSRLVYGQISFLFTGDLEQAGEEEILGLSGVSLNSQVIKIGHHGSETSSGEEFLRAVSPDYAVISVGRDNKFGHPSRRIIKRLQRLGTEILRTDELGDVVFVTGGTDLDYINK